jgi:hypothetical protein
MPDSLWTRLQTKTPLPRIYASSGLQLIHRQSDLETSVHTEHIVQPEERRALMPPPWSLDTN